MSQSVCLAMIVKDEAHVIRRCLDSVLPIISSWVVVDTGSTDGTRDIVRDHLRGLPGALYERPWRNFARNRSEALSLVGMRADYALMIDADDELVIGDRFRLPVPGRDAREVTQRAGVATQECFRALRQGDRDMPRTP